MTGKTIEIIIDATGKVTLQTHGFAGPACRQASDFIEKALGQRTGEKLSAEFFQRDRHSTIGDPRLRTIADPLPSPSFSDIRPPPMEVQ